MKKIILFLSILTISLTVTIVFYVSKKSEVKPTAITIPENADYPNVDLFPYQNLNTGIYARYTNPKEITIYKLGNLSVDEAKFDIDVDLKSQNSSLSQLENLGVKILIKSISDIPTQE